MKHLGLMTRQGRAAEADFYRKNGKDWVTVRFYAYHIKFDFRLDRATLEEALDYLDEHYDEIEAKENKWLDEWSELND